MSTPTDHWMADPAAIIPADIEALIFDCDGTLVDTMPIHFRAWSQAIAGTGLSYPEEVFYSWGGRATEEIIVALSTAQNIPVDVQALAHQKEEIYVSLMHEATAIDVVVEIAKREHGKRKLGVASGGWNRLVRQSLRNIGVEQLFGAVVGADEVAHAKPAPDLFLEAARRLGVNPARCLVYEDGPPGMVGARAAGMKVIDVRPWYMPGHMGK